MLANSLRRGAGTFLGSVGRALRGLGLQLAGVVFLLFALSFAGAGAHGWRASPKPHAWNQIDPWAKVELGMALLFIYFGVSSLLRAGERS